MTDRDLNFIEDKATWDTFAATSSLALVLSSFYWATHEDMPVSATPSLFENRTGHYLIDANGSTAHEPHADTYLMLHMVKTSFNHGDYKLDFNAELRPDFITAS